jgi:hypothetical protein
MGWKSNLKKKKELLGYKAVQSDGFQRTTCCNIPEDGALHNYRCEGLVTYMVNLYFITDLVIK